jgi:hypothetical protein
MRKPSPLNSYAKGRRDRLSYPLSSGRYKLVECAERLEQCIDEIDRIRNYINGRGHRWSLMHCTTEDKHLWLKDLAAHVAYRLGYEFLPGLQALTVDGVDSITINSEIPYFERYCSSVVGQLEIVHQKIYKSINVEYNQMRLGSSLLEPQVRDAFGVTKRALRLIS